MLILNTHEQSNGRLLGQNHQERILRSHLEKMGTVVEFGSELKGFKQSEDHVTVQIIRRSNGEESMEETQVPWLIGTDGAHSIVRKTLGLSFLGETRLADAMVIGDIKVKAGLEHEVKCLFKQSSFGVNLIFMQFWERWAIPPNMCVKTSFVVFYTHI